MTGPRWVDATVRLDDLGPYPAQIIDNQHWNGWAIPRFTRTVVERIAEDLAAANTGLDVHAEVIRFHGDRALIVRAPRTNHERLAEVVEPDADGCYGIGASRWCWSTVD